MITNNRFAKANPNLFHLLVDILQMSISKILFQIIKVKSTKSCNKICRKYVNCDISILLTNRYRDLIYKFITKITSSDQMSHYGQVASGK